LRFKLALCSPDGPSNDQPTHDRGGTLWRDDRP